MLIVVVNLTDCEMMVREEKMVRWMVMGVDDGDDSEWGRKNWMSVSYYSHPAKPNNTLKWVESWIKDEDFWCIQ